MTHKRKYLKIKNQSVQNFEEIIEIADNRRWEKSTKPKHKVDAKYGFYKYDSKVARPIYGEQKNITGYKTYDVELLIRNDADGKSYLYDIQNIKESNDNYSPPANTGQNRHISLLSNNSIAPKGDAVNTQYMQEDGEYSVHNRNNNSVKPMEVGNLYNSMLQEGYITPEEGERYRGVSLRVRQSGEAVGANEVQIAEAERMSRATGREVIFLGGNNDFIGEDGNAYTLQGRAKDGVIYVNPNNGIYISNQVLAEEFIHSIEGTESYKEFVTFISDLAENDPLIDVGAEQAEIKRIYDGAGVKYDLEREFTAQMAAKLLFNDAESVEYLVKNRQSVAGRFFDFLSHYSAKLTGNDEKATVLQARRLLSQALRESEEREITGEVSYSVEYSFNKQVDDALSGKMERGYSVYVGKTPKLLIKAGLPADLPMLINQGHLRTITADREEGDIHLHGIDKDIVKQLPSMLKSPVMIYDSISVDNKDNSVCILTNFKNDIGEPIIVSIKYSETGSKYLDVEFNVQKTDKSNYATSMYGKKNFASHLSDIIDNDAVLYANKSGIEKVLEEKNKTLKLNSDSKLQLLARLDSLGFDTIIHQSRNVVNTYSMQDGGSYSIARKSGATMEQAQKLFNDLTYNGELTDAEKLREIYKKDPSLFNMLRDVVEGERTIAEEGNLDYAAPYDEALFIMGLVEDSNGYTSEEVAESIDAAGWQVEDINKDGLLLDAEYAIICSENAHDVCGEIVRGINRLVPGAFGYSAEEISEIKSIWQRAYDDPEGYSAELEAKKAEADKWNVPENGETVSERAETSIEKSLKKHMGIEEGEKTPHPPQAVPLPLEGKAQKSIDEVTAEMTAEHREMLKTKSKADFDALKGTEKLKAAGVTGITGSVGLYGHTEQAIEQKQGTRETQKAIREVERVLSPDEINFARLVNRGEIDAK